MANPKNREGYTDSTAYTAEKNIEKASSAANKAERELEKRCSNTIATMKLLADLAGFDIVGRIYLKDKRTGKEFK